MVVAFIFMCFHMSHVIYFYEINIGWATRVFPDAIICNMGRAHGPGPWDGPMGRAHGPGPGAGPMAQTRMSFVWAM